VTYQISLDRTIAALADPTRRAVLDKLRPGPMSVGEIAAGMPVSRPAVSQHLKALKVAGLVETEPRGAARFYRVNPTGLADLRAWIESYWEGPLTAFKSYAERDRENG
jgi:DNA-binding transcriptional ArsR family regulator